MQANLNLIMEDKDHQIKELQNQLKKASEKIEALEQQVQLNRSTRMTIFSNLNHEIRNPLNGIMGFSELLSSTEVSFEEQKQYSSAIAESSRALLSIINDVFVIARVEANRINVYPVDFDLNDLIYELYDEYRIKAESKQLHFFLENLISEPYMIKSDPDVLKRILKKLLDNAIKFTKSGSVKLKYEVEGTDIHFEVEDTGIGIPKNLWSNLFDRFITEEVSKSRNIGGTGIDLSLCNGLVSLLSGKIWYESKGTEGSIFHFSIHNQDEKSIM